MRIIRGRLQRRVINLPNNLNVRPTTDLAKEALFNTLESRISLDDISVLDLFAGTGNMSYEFTSRGAHKVIAIEQNKTCSDFIYKTIKAFDLNEMVLIQTDVFKWLNASTQDRFDVIFADPPYAIGFESYIEIYTKSLLLLFSGGYLILEHDKTHDFSSLPHFEYTKKYGGVMFSFFMMA